MQHYNDIASVFTNINSVVIKINDQCDIINP